MYRLIYHCFGRSCLYFLYFYPEGGGRMFLSMVNSYFKTARHMSVIPPWTYLLFCSSAWTYASHDFQILRELLWCCDINKILGTYKLGSVHRPQRLLYVRCVIDPVFFLCEFVHCSRNTIAAFFSFSRHVTSQTPAIVMLCVLPLWLD